MKDLREYYYGFGYDILDDVTSWIADNISPELFYEEKELNDWVVEYAGDIFDPEDIFSYDDLKKWALENGFVEEE